MKKFFLFLLVCALIAGAGGFGLFWFKPQTFALVKSEVDSVADKIIAFKERMFENESGEVFPFQLATVKRGEIFSRISTTGTVNPVSSVTVSTQVSGTIKDMPVEVTSEVKEGDLVAKLDQDLFHAEVLQAEAKLDKARASLAREQAGVQMLKSRINASIAGTRSSFKSLEDKFKRSENLFKRQLISKDEYETVRADYELAAARFHEESARVDEIAVKLADIKGMEAEVKQAEAELEIARVKVNHSVIRAPITGMVIEKTVEAGQTIAANFSSPPLVTIADLTSMKVDAWVDEADIGRVRLGQDVDFQVDSYPNRVFQGKVVRIFPSPEIKDNVVTYDTEIRVDNHDLALKPGMTANVTIVLARKDQVPIVPMAALRISARDVRALYPDMPAPAGGRRRLTPEEQRRRYLEGRGAVWVYRSGSPERARIRFGATDTKNMEILEGLQEGDEVIVGIKAEFSKQLADNNGRAAGVRSRILGGL